jgi:hypothetical protein
MHTYRTALALVGLDVPEHLIADAEVPILTGPQAQGDLMVIPVDDAPASLPWRVLRAAGLPIVEGEATANTHWLHPGFDSPGVRWASTAGGITLGWLDVPDGQSAQLIHTDEHGANGIGPGYYRINRKREQSVTYADRPRIVRD